VWASTLVQVLELEQRWDPGLDTDMMNNHLSKYHLQYCTYYLCSTEECMYTLFQHLANCSNQIQLWPSEWALGLR
jgi:hypothetical protein